MCACPRACICGACVCVCVCVCVCLYTVTSPALPRSSCEPSRTHVRTNAASCIVVDTRTPRCLIPCTRPGPAANRSSCRLGSSEPAQGEPVLHLPTGPPRVRQTGCLSCHLCHCPPAPVSLSQLSYSVSRWQGSLRALHPQTPRLTGYGPGRAGAQPCGTCNAPSLHRLHHGPADSRYMGRALRCGSAVGVCGRGRDAATGC